MRKLKSLSNKDYLLHQLTKDETSHHDVRKLISKFLDDE